MANNVTNGYIDAMLWLDSLISWVQSPENFNAMVPTATVVACTIALMIWGTVTAKIMLNRLARMRAKHFAPPKPRTREKEIPVTGPVRRGNPL
jgi:hypothetical protein